MSAHDSSSRLRAGPRTLRFRRGSTVRFALGLYGFVGGPFPVANAHDSWLVPATNQVGGDDAVRVALVTGDVFPISDHATAKDRVAEWVVARAAEPLPHGIRRVPVSGIAVEEKELRCFAPVVQPGTSIIALALKAKYIELEAAKFEEYLREEHADAAIELRRSRGETDKPGRELYTKFAKTFVQVSHSTLPCFWHSPVGHRLEIIPAFDPVQMRAGMEMKVRVRLDGEPAVGLWVSGGHENLPPHTYATTARTNAEGEANIALTKSGLWFLRTHVIRRRPEPDRQRAADETPEGPDATADWESFWASITFHVRPEMPPFEE